MLRYVRRDLLRNPRRTLASLVGVVLGVGLFSAVLFFIDGSGASMTSRAIAPVAIDMQRVSTAPLGETVRLAQRLSGSGRLRRGERARMVLTARNLGAGPENEVLVGDKLPPQLRYVPGSARRDGAPIPDPAGESPFAHGPGRIGRNLGTLAAGAAVRLTYAVEAAAPVPDRAALRLRATIAGREHPVPDRANRPDLVPPRALRERIAALPGVAAAAGLGFAELPPGSLRAGGRRIERPLKVFAFDRDYARQYPAIRLAQGGFAPGAALLSPAAARGLGAGPGAEVELGVLGAKPVSLPVSGVADLSRARALFNSREGLKLEDFLYLPDSIVISPEAFERIVIPAFRRASAARGNALAVKSPPTLEVDVQLERRPLNSDPARALAQTTAVAERIKRIAPGQDYLLDNVSNTLTVARADAAVAKRVFLFLGLPGLLLAGFLAAYAGAILAASQRREQANLRLRGAGLGHLTRILAYRTAALAGAGALLGTALGFASALAVLGRTALFEASPAQLAVSAAIAIGAGVLATGLALYLPGRMALRREVSGERRELAMAHQPRWRRLRLDYAALALASAAAFAAVRAGAFDAPAGAVSTGEATSLRSPLLVLPLGVWFAGSLLSVRLFEGVARTLRHAPAPRFGPLVRGLLARTLSRRSRALVTGIAGVGLVMAFANGLAIFAATYDDAKQADAAFTVGSDLRVTPSPVGDTPHPAGFARALEVGPVTRATPVIAGLENAFMRSDFNSDVKDLAAIDPASFAATAPLSDEDFRGATAAAALGGAAGRAVGDPARRDLRRGAQAPRRRRGRGPARARDPPPAAAPDEGRGPLRALPGLPRRAADRREPRLLPARDGNRGRRLLPRPCPRPEPRRARGGDGGHPARAGRGRAPERRHHEDDLQQGPVEPDRGQRPRARRPRLALHARDQRGGDRDLRLRPACSSAAASTWCCERRACPPGGCGC